MELMAPAGDFQSAYQALTHGADAVYLGLRSYSARKSAKNLSTDELRRIVKFAHDQGKKVYLAMNTLIKESELKHIIRLLHEVSLTGIDGIIVQDLGLIDIIHSHFPLLELHGSTQLAVHNASGVRFLQSIGFTRVVLARELTFEEIASIRKECPDVELKVFIHGALCYSISGMCLASGTILGRSGNRGACGQICRTFSKLNDRFGYFFSMKDLSLKEKILRLQEIGIDALKIEGRMKSPTYAAETSAMYRAIIDGKPYDASASDLAFSRVSADGWAGSYHRPDRDDSDTSLVNPSFSGHIGLEAGKIIGKRGKFAEVRAYRSLAVRDGIQLIRDDERLPGLEKGEPFSITSMKGKKSRSLTSCRKGDVVTIPIKGSFSIGETIYQVSGHDTDLKNINPLSLKPFTYPISTEIRLYRGHLRIMTSIEGIDFSCSMERPMEISEAKHPKAIGPILEKGFCVQDPELPFMTAGVPYENHTGLDDDRIFIPPKLLKQGRREWYEQISKALEAHIASHTEEIISGFTVSGSVTQELPKRSLITDEGYSTDDAVYLPLPPVQFFQRDFTRIEQRIEELKITHPGKRIIVGISNIGQIPWYEKQQGLSCYIDYYLYCANSQAVKLLAERLHDCIGVYYWIEDSDRPVAAGHDDWGIPLSYIDQEFIPPIFITRTCFRKDSLRMSCADCRDRSYEYTLEQKGRDYRVVVKDCMSYVYVKKP